MTLICWLERKFNREMETEKFLGSLLYVLNGEVRLDYIELIRKYLEKTEEILINLTKIDICLTVDCWNEYFILKNSKLELTDDYKENSEIIKNRFFDKMNYTQKASFWKVLDEIKL